MAPAKMRYHRVLGIAVKALVLLLAVLYITDKSHHCLPYIKKSNPLSQSPNPLSQSPNPPFQSLNLPFQLVNTYSLSYNPTQPPNRPSQLTKTYSQSSSPKSQSSNPFSRAVNPSSSSHPPPDLSLVMSVTSITGRGEILVKKGEENKEAVMEGSKEREGEGYGGKGEEEREKEGREGEDNMKEGREEEERGTTEGKMTGEGEKDERSEKGGEVEGENEEEERGEKRGGPEEDIALDSFLAPNNLTIRYLAEERSFCRDPGLQVIFYVHTSPGNTKFRNAIRATWGNHKWYPILRHKVLYVMGKPVDDEILAGVLQESRIHHDILLADFQDAYQNLTYKAVSALHWIHRHCTTPTFIIKSDDDMMINIFAVARYLKDKGGHEADDATKEQKRKNDGGADQAESSNVKPEATEKPKNLPTKQVQDPRIHCSVWGNSSPFRNTNSKFYISRSDYKEDKYPPFCSGSVFIMDWIVAPTLLKASTSIHFLRFDDVFITGLLRVATGVKLVNINKLYKLKLSAGKTLTPSLLGKGVVFLHLPHKYISQLFDSAWNLILKGENITVKSVLS